LSGSTRATPAIVVATAEPRRNGPTKIAVVAMASPAPGLAARVATRVAIEFAASWTPFVNANASARAIAMVEPMSIRGA
jgi:hypothetical protein